MNNPRITLLHSQHQQLREYLQAHPDGHERAAIVLFKRYHRSIGDMPSSDRYVAIEVHPFEDSWIISSSPSHIAFGTKYLREFFRRCSEESLVFGFVHIHPGGFPEFSDVDEDNERALLQAIRNRNGPQIHFVALLWTREAWRARVRSGETPHEAQAARHVLVTSRPLQIFMDNSVAAADDEMFSRQAAAFGVPFVKQLQSLRVGVIGAGGTGSPTITLLARAGIGEMIIVDGDQLEESNLNRVRGASARDIGKNKAHILQDFIHSLSLPTKTVAFEGLIDRDPEAIDAISSCDFIFGCTDDQIGREVLNTAVYVFALPYVDLGLGGQVANGLNGQPYLRYHHGRVSTILPEEGECLFCQGVIRGDWIQHQYALRENPDMSPSEARERYLEGSGEQAPGVGPFTSAVADYGVATLFDLIKPFRKWPGELRWDAFSLDFVKMSHRSKEQTNNPDCPYCRRKEYLLVKEKYRLNRPVLGKPYVAR
jgi:molybdopterin-synthase adenylyltransferase